MSFLRRLLGGGSEESGNGAAAPAPAMESEPADDRSADDTERDYERELLREEARRLDELQQRQLRYADKAWTPPPQGGERRADHEDSPREA